MDAYPLRNIPDDLWQQVKVRALTEKLTVRDVIMRALERYAAGVEADGATRATSTRRRTNQELK